MSTTQIESSESVILEANKYYNDILTKISSEVIDTSSTITIPDALQLSIKDLIGKSTLDNGGLIGDLFKLVRSHISNMKDEQEVTNEVAGQVYSSLMSTIITACMDYQTKQILIPIQAYSDLQGSALRKEQVISEHFKHVLQSYETAKLNEDIALTTANISAVDTQTALEEEKLNTARYITTDSAIKVGIVPQDYTGTIDDSLTRQQVKSAKAQQELLGRQKDAFDDRKYYNIMKEQLNYLAMISPDLENPQLPDMTATPLINKVYNRAIDPNDIVSPKAI